MLLGHVTSAHGLGRARTGNMDELDQNARKEQNEVATWTQETLEYLKNGTINSCAVPKRVTATEFAFVKAVRSEMEEWLGETMLAENAVVRVLLVDGIMICNAYRRENESGKQKMIPVLTRVICLASLMMHQVGRPMSHLYPPIMACICDERERIIRDVAKIPREGHGVVANVQQLAMAEWCYWLASISWASTPSDMSFAREALRNQVLEMADDNDIKFDAGREPESLSVLMGGETGKTTSELHFLGYMMHLHTERDAKIAMAEYLRAFLLVKQSPVSLKKVITGLVQLMKGLEQWYQKRVIVETDINSIPTMCTLEGNPCRARWYRLISTCMEGWSLPDNEHEAAMRRFIEPVCASLRAIRDMLDENTRGNGGRPGLGSGDFFRMLVLRTANDVSGIMNSYQGLIGNQKFFIFDALVWDALDVLGRSIMVLAEDIVVVETGLKFLGSIFAIKFWSAAAGSDLGRKPYVFILCKMAIDILLKIMEKVGAFIQPFSLPRDLATGVSVDADYGSRWYNSCGGVVVRELVQLVGNIVSALPVAVLRLYQDDMIQGAMLLASRVDKLLSVETVVHVRQLVAPFFSMKREFVRRFKTMLDLGDVCFEVVSAGRQVLEVVADKEKQQNEEDEDVEDEDELYGDFGVSLRAIKESVSWTLIECLKAFFIRVCQGWMAHKMVPPFPFCASVAEKAVVQPCIDYFERQEIQSPSCREWCTRVIAEDDPLGLRKEMCMLLWFMERSCHEKPRAFDNQVVYLLAVMNLDAWWGMCNAFIRLARLNEQKEKEALAFLASWKESLVLAVTQVGRSAFVAKVTSFRRLLSIRTRT